MRRPVILCLIAACSAVTIPGCFTAAGEGIAAMRGASGTYTEIKPVADVKDNLALSQYTNFELGTIKDSFGGKVPERLFLALTPEFDKAIRNAKLPTDPTGKTLIIRGEIVYFELRGSALGLVLSDVEEVVTRLELVDKASGRVLGTAMCVGRTTHRMTMGIDKKAEGLARAIAEWIAAYYPKKDK